MGIAVQEAMVWLGRNENIRKCAQCTRPFRPNERSKTMCPECMKEAARDAGAEYVKRQKEETLSLLPSIIYEKENKSEEE